MSPPQGLYSLGIVKSNKWYLWPPWHKSIVVSYLDLLFYCCCRNRRRPTLSLRSPAATAGNSGGSLRVAQVKLSHKNRVVFKHLETPPPTHGKWLSANWICIYLLMETSSSSSSSSPPPLPHSTVHGPMKRVRQ